MRLVAIAIVLIAAAGAGGYAVGQSSSSSGSSSDESLHERNTVQLMHNLCLEIAKIRTPKSNPNANSNWCFGSASSVAPPVGGAGQGGLLQHDAALRSEVGTLCGLVEEIRVGSLSGSDGGCLRGYRSLAGH